MENLRIQMKIKDEPRYADTVVYQLWYILTTECNDTILFNKWKCEFMWFDRFRFEVYAFKYYHWSPEKIEETKWHKLSQIIEDCIPPFQTPVHIWEKKILDVFLGNYRGDDLPRDQVCIDVLDE
jgi:hypothetical protein